MDFDLKNLGMTEEKLFSFHEHSDLESEKITAPRYSYWQSVLRVFFRKKSNIVILCLFVFLIAFAYIYPALTEYNRFGELLNPDAKHLSPSAALDYFGWNIKYILGTGASGQSTFDAIWDGSRISISMAFICGAVNMTIGVILGAVWGFAKTVDSIMMAVYNVIGNVPYILLISVVMMLFKPTFWTLVLAMTLTGWLYIAYAIRIQVVIIRDREYTLASKCLGTSTFKIAMKNILPFMTSIIVTMLATEIPSYISYEVFLSYIGRGISEMTLGRLIYEAESAMVTSGWEFEFWSPVAISAIITVVLYVVGQNLGDASDPRTHM